MAGVEAEPSPQSYLTWGLGRRGDLDPSHPSVRQSARLLAAEAILGQIRNGFQVGLAAAENRYRLDFQETIGPRYPKIRDADFAQAIADFLRRH